MMDLIHKCPLCKSSKTKFLLTSLNKHGEAVFSNDTFDLYRCEYCETVFLPKIHEEPDYYKKYYPTGKMYLGRLSKPAQKFFKYIKIISSKLRYKKIIKVVHKLNKDKNKYSLLDIGCGKGVFLSQIPSTKLNKYGIDINQDALDNNLSTDATLIKNDFLKHNFEMKFDIVTLFHALEHFPEPKCYIEQAREILDENGVLAIILPNTNSLGFKYGKANWFHLDSPRHLFLPTEKGLVSALNNSGFEILSVSNPWYEYPFDLIHTMDSKVLKFLTVLFYLPLKIISKETIFVVARRVK